MTRADVIKIVLQKTYGMGPMVAACANEVDSRWEELNTGATQYRDGLVVFLWNWFSGGDTAEFAAGQVRKAVAHWLTTQSGQPGA